MAIPDRLSVALAETLKLVGLIFVFSISVVLNTGPVLSSFTVLSCWPDTFPALSIVCTFILVVPSLAIVIGFDISFSIIPSVVSFR